MMRPVRSLSWLIGAAALTAFQTAHAVRPQPSAWRARADPYSELPVFYRASAGTTWITVDPNSDCNPMLVSGGGDVHDFTSMSSTEVFCFENTDSLWPAGAGGSRQDHWNHWSINLPPVPAPSRWHASTYYGDAFTGPFNAWAGCHESEPTTPCQDMAYWVRQDSTAVEGYGNEWEESLILDVRSYGGGSPATLVFDLRYDTECVYDYLYLEYMNSTTSSWTVLDDTLGPGGTAAVFNAVSNPDTSGTACEEGQNGTRLDGNYFNSVAGTQHLNSAWYRDVTFPVPAGSNLQIRWRASSDPAWSDEDGLNGADTEGLAAIDNVILSFSGGAIPDTVRDNFDSGDFVSGATIVQNGIPAIDPSLWQFGGGGNTYDGWHLSFNPSYTNKGKTCTFSDDWMWAAKPDGSPIPENGFQFFLTSPIIPTPGWSGGTIFYSAYQCARSAQEDYTDTLIRVYDATLGGWSPWNNFDDLVLFMGCDFWNLTEVEDLTPYLGPTVDSVQAAWVLLDGSQPGDFSWGRHGAVQYLVDNVAIGSFDGQSTVFRLRGIDLFTDTFSLRDPAHTSFLQNAEQGLHPGRPFGPQDSLTIEVSDQDGISGPTPVKMWWRHDTGPGTAWSAWASKNMTFSLQNPARGPGEGTYRTVIGQDGTSEDRDPLSANIWLAGETIQYYITVVDDVANTSYWPGSAAPPDSGYAEFSILPFNINTEGGVADTTDNNGHPLDTQNAGAHYILLVDDYGRGALDFENSTGYDPVGGVDPEGDGTGEGLFTGPAIATPEDMAERALAILFGASDTDGDGSYSQHSLEARWDKYDVIGAGSNVQCEPRGTSLSVMGTHAAGAYATDALTPYYDALIWLQGTFDLDSYADTTRLELASYLNNGGCLFSTGDEVAFHLGSGGNNADSAIGFGVNYLGVSLTTQADNATTDRTLNFCGSSGTSMDGVKLGIYGECPLRRTFDRVLVSNPSGGATAVELGIYCDSVSGSDNGRVAATRCVQSGGGTAVHFAFGIEALLSDASRAVLLGRFLATDCGFPETQVPAVINGVDAPVAAEAGAFHLAAAHPNPFGDATAFRFSVPQRTHVTIDVFNILGQKVRTLVDETMPASSYVRRWDGRSDAGPSVASGIYFYKMVAGDFVATRKVVRLR